MLRQSREILGGFLLLAVLVIGLMATEALGRLDQALYGEQTRWLRAPAPGVLPQDVVVIGLDERAYESIPEPYALWHRHLDAPERHALEAAQEMLLRLGRLNAEFRAQGRAPLAIGIHACEVLAGYVGTRQRRDFTVIGDAVNTASRLEALSKTLGHSIICSREITAAVGQAGGLVDLGAQAVKGRSDVHVWGWMPPLHR